MDVSLPQNKWYKQLIASSVTPTALVFSSRGELEAIISGSNKARLACLESTLNGQSDCSHYLSSTSFSKSVKNENMIKALNLVLKAKIKVEKKEDATSELEESLNTLYYPYALWLQIQNSKNKKEEQEAVFLARQMLTFQDPFYAFLYNDLYLESRYIINPDFDIKNAPSLEIENDNIDLGNRKTGEKIDILIKLRNAGKDTLRIYDVSVSCSCLKLLSKNKDVLEAGGEDILHLEFLADYEGKIKRNVSITTNGIESVQSVVIKANVEE